MTIPPVALIVFNRPEPARQVMAEIRRAQPAKLYLIADGPRAGRDGEAERCREVREIVSAVDWPCEVQTNFAEQNLGCKNRVASGISWVFEQEEEAIILEDDCVPAPSFFRFCAEMLDRYRDDTRVMQIAGSNILGGVQPCESASYFFSGRAHIWGWATWRRAWDRFDIAMPDWPLIRDGDRLAALSLPKLARQAYYAQLERVYTGKLDSWGYIWTMTVLANYGMTVVPAQNLIGNIGFGDDATHTMDDADPLADLARGDLSFPLQHPRVLLPDVAWDRQFDARMNRGILERAVRKANRILRRLTQTRSGRG